MNKPFVTALIWIAGTLLVAAAYRGYGWPGVALVVGGVVFWLLLHFTRTMQTLKRAANRPIGYVGSAVMLNSRLKPGLKLLDVVTLTGSLGALQTPKDQQPELYRWTDPGEAFVDCEFLAGKLVRFEMLRNGEG